MFDFILVFFFTCMAIVILGLHLYEFIRKTSEDNNELMSEDNNNQNFEFKDPIENKTRNKAFGN